MQNYIIIACIGVLLLFGISFLLTLAIDRLLLKKRSQLSSLEEQLVLAKAQIVQSEEHIVGLMAQIQQGCAQLETLEAEEERLQREVETLKGASEAADTYYRHKLDSNEQHFKRQISYLRQQRNDAVQLAKSGYELEKEKAKEEYKAELQAELQQLRDNSGIEQKLEEIRKVDADLATVRRDLELAQKQVQLNLEKEDFDAAHSISITENDQDDIALIRQFSNRLNRKEAFRKLVWTEFIQKPVQTLCKQLGAEKTTGIYKITDKGTGRMYIGQAVDIAARWKDHCKLGLGIGSTAYLTNKFYKELYNKGIENFTFEILEENPANLNERERYWISFYDATGFGFNAKIGG